MVVKRKEIHLKKASSLITLALVFILWLTLAIGCKNSGVVSNSQQSPNSNSQNQSSEASKTEKSLSPSEVRITKQEFGTKWPFTVDEGTLACKGKSSFGEVIFTANGKTYAINGTAKGTKKYLSIDEIWADNPSVSGVKKDIGPIIERGLKLCQ
jgi:hypothetical protein